MRFRALYYSFISLVSVVYQLYQFSSLQTHAKPEYNNQILDLTISFAIAPIVLLQCNHEKY